eukprot:2678537-Rhodomonas_salina.1
MCPASAGGCACDSHRATIARAARSRSPSLSTRSNTAISVTSPLKWSCEATESKPDPWVPLAPRVKFLRPLLAFSAAEGE